MAECLRFIHAADIHLGAPFRGLRQPPEVWKQRLMDSIPEAFDRVVKAAIRYSVDFVVIAGDVFDLAGASYRDYRHFVEGMKLLQDKGIPAYVCTGNHDPYTVWEDEFQNLPENVTLFSADHPDYALYRRNGKPLCVLAGRGFLYKVFPDDEFINAGMTRTQAEEVLGGDASEAPFAVGVMHTGLHLDPYKAPTDINVLLESGMDYWALGHIHARWADSETNPRVAYSGSIQARDIKERGKRGVSLVTLQVGEPNRVQLIPTASVVTQRPSIDVSLCKTLLDIPPLVMREQFQLNGSSYCERMVTTVTLTGESSLHDKLTDPRILEELRGSLNESYAAFYCDALIDETVPVGQSGKMTNPSETEVRQMVQEAYLTEGLTIPTLFPFSLDDSARKAGIWLQDARPLGSSRKSLNSRQENRSSSESPSPTFGVVGNASAFDADGHSLTSETPENLYATINCLMQESRDQVEELEAQNKALETSCTELLETENAYKRQDNELAGLRKTLASVEQKLNQVNTASETLEALRVEFSEVQAEIAECSRERTELLSDRDEATALQVKAHRVSPALLKLTDVDERVLRDELELLHDLKLRREHATEEAKRVFRDAQANYESLAGYIRTGRSLNVISPEEFLNREALAKAGGSESGSDEFPKGLPEPILEQAAAASTRRDPVDEAASSTEDAFSQEASDDAPQTEWEKGVDRTETKTLRHVLPLVIFSIAFLFGGVLALALGFGPAGIPIAVLGLVLIFVAIVMGGATSLTYYRAFNDIDHWSDKATEAQNDFKREELKLNATVKEEQESEQAIRAYLEENGLEEANGSVRRAFALLDEAKTARVDLELANSAYEKATARLSRVEESWESLKTRQGALLEKLNNEFVFPTALRPFTVQDTQGIQKLHDSIVEHRQTYQQEIHRLSEKIGSWEQELSLAEKSRAYDEQKLERQIVVTRLNGALEEFTKFAIAKNLAQSPDVEKAMAPSANDCEETTTSSDGSSE